MRQTKLIFILVLLILVSSSTSHAILRWRAGFGLQYGISYYAGELLEEKSMEILTLAIEWTIPGEAPIVRFAVPSMEMFIRSTWRTI